MITGMDLKRVAAGIQKGTRLYIVKRCSNSFILRSKRLVSTSKLNVSFRVKMKQQMTTCNKNTRNQDSKKAASGSDNPSSRKHCSKRKNRTCFTETTEQSSESGFFTCKNSACRATLSINDAFCKRCSCCLCHQFDDNKDPSLWLTCESESSAEDSCGLSCHIECALQRGKAGVVNLGQSMELDGSHCCACGNVTPIIGWKKQLAIAKNARRINVLCYRINLSYRLLNGTAKFKDLLDVLTDAKMKLEAEVGPLDGDAINTSRGLVSRLAVASDVLKLCSHAIDQADEWLLNTSALSNCRVDNFSTVCRLSFDEITSSSVVIVLIELPTPLADHIKGYKLWCCKSRGGEFSKEPIFTCPRENNRILIEQLQPCTEYTFLIACDTETGDSGYFLTSCSTRSEEIVKRTKNLDLNVAPTSDSDEEFNPFLGF